MLQILEMRTQRGLLVRELYGFLRFRMTSPASPTFGENQTLHKSVMLVHLVVTPIGFEPITCPLGGGCSVQLSHGATNT